MSPRLPPLAGPFSTFSTNNHQLAREMTCVTSLRVQEMLQRSRPALSRRGERGNKIQRAFRLSTGAISWEQRFRFFRAQRCTYFRFSALESALVRTAESMFAARHQEKRQLMPCVGRETRGKGNNGALKICRKRCRDAEAEEKKATTKNKLLSHLGRARRAKQHGAGEQRCRSSRVGASHRKREERELGGRGKKGN